MESAYTKLALYGSQNECAKTDNIISPISEFCDGTVSLRIIDLLCLSKSHGLRDFGPFIRQ